MFVTNAVHGVQPVRSNGRQPSGLAGGPARWPDQRRPSPGSRCSRRETATASHAGHRQPASKPGRRRDRAGPVTVLIDNYDSFTYNLAHMLAASGCRVEVVRNDEVSAQQVASFGPAGVVISPGPCAPADAGISVDVVRVCGGQAPLLGVCLGHQAIATAFGATIVAAPRPVHGQTSSITHDGHGLLTGLSQPFKATRYHSLMVAVGSLPPFLSVTATARGPVARLPLSGLRIL